jgi:CheY-like chemotaxis protein
MNIEYNILWLDDQINEFVEDEWVKKIEKYLEDEGFIPKIITISKYEEFVQKLDDSFDLILTDFHMTSKNGDEVVNEIRKKSILTEILFYTAQGDLTEMGKIDRVSFVETHGNHHEQVIQETIKLISLTIKKFQHIVSMRGMIMHETSTLDNSTTDILAKYIGSGKVNYDQITDFICEKMSAHLQSKQEFVKKVKQNHNLKKLMKDNYLFSADYKIDALKKILFDLKTTDFTDDYKKEVNNIRNIFAHVILITDEQTGKRYFKARDNEINFDEELCKQIRKNIRKHKGNIDRLQTDLDLFVENM